MRKRIISKAIVSLITAFCLVVNTGCAPISFLDYLLEDEETESTSTSGTGNGTGNIYSSGTMAAQTAVAAGLLENGAVREPKVKLKGNGEDTVTVLIYMNGSDLESESGEASTDLSEMVKAGSSDKVNVLVQTMGTKKWTNYGISSRKSQIYSVDGSGVNLVKDDMGQLDCTDPNALSDFIAWGAANYPADRYILLFWDHGGGPVYGFGSDEWNEDEYASLTIDEMQTALSRGGVYFDFIGMDCCIMSCLEVCAALYDYCDYAVLSEDFESGLGWNYTPWLSALYENTSISTPQLGKEIVDAMVQANVEDSYAGDDSILAVIDQAMLRVLWQTWTDFAYANESTLLNSNYSRPVQREDNGRIHPLIKPRFSDSWDDFSFSDYYSEEGEPEMSEYYVTDIMAVASNIDTAESSALRAALDNAIVYMAASEGDKDLTGISVTLPYGDAVFYADLKRIFTNCSFDAEYIAWLEKFVSAAGLGSYYDYSDWEDDWDGWDSYDDDYDWDSWLYGGDSCDDYWDDWDIWGDFGCDDYSCYDYDYYDDDYDYFSYYYDDDYGW
jgi:hypothetical protein